MITMAINHLRVLGLILQVFTILCGNYQPKKSCPVSSLIPVGFIGRKVKLTTWIYPEIQLDRHVKVLIYHIQGSSETVKQWPFCPRKIALLSLQILPMVSCCPVAQWVQGIKALSAKQLWWLWWSLWLLLVMVPSNSGFQLTSWWFVDMSVFFSRLLFFQQLSLKNGWFLKVSFGIFWRNHQPVRWEGTTQLQVLKVHGVKLHQVIRPPEGPNPCFTRKWWTLEDSWRFPTKKNISFSQVPY